MVASGLFDGTSELLVEVWSWSCEGVGISLADDQYEFGIFVKERRRCYFKSDRLITKELQTITKMITTFDTD